jgi:hypothetical protein
MDTDAVLLDLVSNIGELNANSSTLFNEITAIKKHVVGIEKRMDEEAKEYNYNSGRLAFIYVMIGGVIVFIGNKIMSVLGSI